MDAPRCKWLLGMLLLGIFLVGIHPAMARADQSALDRISERPASELDEDMEEGLVPVLTPLVSQFQVLALTLGVPPPWYVGPARKTQPKSVPPVNYYQPLIVRPPMVQQFPGSPPLPGNPKDDITRTPEPGTLILGLVASGFALVSRLRKRRGRLAEPGGQDSQVQLT